MAKQLFLNNFTSTFVAAVKDIPSSGTPATELDYGILRLSDGAAGALINPTGGDYYVLTGFKRSGSIESNIEVMRVTAVDNSTPGECRITVMRAQEGTSAKTFVSGDFVSLRMTKGTAERFSQPGDLATKEPVITAGTSAQYWRGDKSWQDFATDVRAATLAGLSTATNAVITAADTALAALGKLQAQITGHTGASSGAHAATAISNTPSGNIAATTVQAAINELDSEKQATLVSGTNIKTAGGQNLVGSGDAPIVAPETHAATAKTTPADADELGLSDSAASWALKKLTFANLKSWIDGLFVPKSGGTMTGNLNAPSINGGQLAGLRNKIINGSFDVWQRGTSLTVSSGYSNGYYLADRGLSAADASTTGSFTLSSQSFTPGQTLVPYEPTFFYRMATSSLVNGTNGFTYLYQQRIEGVRTFAGQTATISFYANVSANATIAVALTQAFGSGGSGSVIVPAQTLALTPGFKKYTLTFTVPSISGKTIGANDYLALEIFAGLRGTTATAYGVAEFQVLANGSYDLAQVQLEPGSVATPFEHRPYGMELALCQRYYRVLCTPGVNAQYVIGSGMMLSTTAPKFVIRLDQPMRTTPSFSISSAGHFTVFAGGGTAALNSFVISGQSDASNIALDGVTSAGLTNTAVALIYTNVTTASAALSAEL